MDDSTHLSCAILLYDNSLLSTLVAYYYHTALVHKVLFMVSTELVILYLIIFDI